MLPSRFLVDDDLRARFGPRLDELGRLLCVGDPAADAAVEALAGLPRGRAHAVMAELLRGDAPADAPAAARAMVDALRSPPSWWDPRLGDRGAAWFLRTGVLGGIVLGARSIVLGYVAPGGNKPLMFSGNLVRSATRRLAETSRFVTAVHTPGGMAFGADGFTITTQVRLMHAWVRHDLRRDPRWRTADWGLPINQHDMAATNLLFSTVALDGLRRFGLRPAADDVAGFLHLWRYVGHVIGVDGELLCETEAQGAELMRMILATQGPPDDDARTLVQALLDANDDRRARPLGEALLRFQLGDELADQLGLPRRRATLGLRWLSRLVTPLDLLRAACPLTDGWLERAGLRYWEGAVQQGLGSEPARFAIP